MKSVSAFRTRIAPRVPGCSDALIDQAVLDACIDFCERSLVVKRMLDSFVTKPLQAIYDLYGANQQGVAQIMRVWVDSTEITPLDEDAISTPFGFVSSVPGQSNPGSTPRFFNETEPNSISLYPTPDKVYTLNMRVALKPMRSATQVEDQLFEDWVEVVMDGAFARLFAMPAQEFTSPALTKYHAVQYEVGVNAAMLQARRGNTRAQSRVTPVHI